jgi:hypothetical protein
MHAVHFWFKSPDLFRGTVFDGELIQQGRSWTFVIGDILLDRCKGLGNVNLIKRLNRIYDVLSKELLTDALQPFDLEVKRYFQYQEVHEMLDKFIPSLPYDIRGVRFKSLHLKFKDLIVWIPPSKPDSTASASATATQEGLQPTKRVRSKMKKSEPEPEPEPEPENPKLSVEIDRTIDQVFEVRKTLLPDIYELDVFGTKELACIPTISLSRAMRGLFEVQDKTLPIACRFHERFGKWVPLVPDCPC